MAVAVSGGADSMALTLLAQDWVKQYGGQLTALTVDHRLRHESTNEAQQVANWLATHGIAHHTLTPEHTAAGNNLSAAARTWRYDALTNWCRMHHVLHLLIAHHADDQAETSHLMQARGGNTAGAAGMPWVRNHAGVRILRPLLETPCAALRDYLRAKHQPWVEDPSNQDETHARIQARQALQAQPERMAELLANATANGHARAQDDHAHATASYQCVALDMAQRTATITREPFMALPSNTACRLLADLLRSLRGTHTRPRRHETTRLYQALVAGDAHHTLYGSKITLDAGEIRFTPEATMQGSATPPAIAVAPARFWA